MHHPFGVCACVFTVLGSFKDLSGLPSETEAFYVYVFLQQSEFGSEVCLLKKTKRGGLYHKPAGGLIVSCNLLPFIYLSINSNRAPCHVWYKHYHKHNVFL